MEFKKDNQKFIFSITSWPLYMIMRIFRCSIIKSLQKSLHKQISPEDAAHNFVLNMKNMKGVCNSNNITFYSVMQPLNGMGKRNLTDSDKVILSVMKRTQVKKGYSLFDFYIDYYRSIRKEMSNEKNYIDMTDVFDKHEGQIFFDTCHFSDKGQEIVAQALFETIVKEVPK